MSIDWITVAAQIANFLVLVWLLKRFLYRPILEGIDAREVEITERMQEAGQAKVLAEEQERTYHNKVQALNLAQAQMTETIRKSAQEQSDVLLSETQQRMQREHAAWKANLDGETHKYTAKMQRTGAGALLSLTRKALKDLGDETLEARMAHHLIQQLAPMTPELKDAAGQATKAVIASQSPLPEVVQEDLIAGLQTVFPDIPVAFETDSAEALGLVLRIGGAQVAWTVDSYIDGLEALVDAKLSAGSDLRGAPDAQ